MYTLGACVLKSYAFVDHVVFLRAFAISLLLNVAYYLQNLLKSKRLYAN